MKRQKKVDAFIDSYKRRRHKPTVVSGSQRYPDGHASNLQTEHVQHSDERTVLFCLGKYTQCFVVRCAIILGLGSTVFSRYKLERHIVMVYCFMLHRVVDFEFVEV